MSFRVENFLSPAQLALCHRHLALLKKWNESFNLTSITGSQEMWIKHVLDSLAVVPYLPKSSSLRFLDVGTGGGFPGVPLAIARPDLTFVLLDSNSKKVKFLTQVKISLGLKNIFPVHERVEAFTVAEEDKFDGILSRAFSSLGNMVEQSQHLLAKDGKFYALKGLEEEPIPTGRVLERELNLDIPGLNATRRLLIF